MKSRHPSDRFHEAVPNGSTLEHLYSMLGTTNLVHGDHFKQETSSVATGSVNEWIL